MKRSIPSSLVVSEIASQLNRFPIFSNTKNALLVITRHSYDEDGYLDPKRCLKAVGITKVYSKDRGKDIAIVHCSSAVPQGIDLTLAKELLSHLSNLPLYACIDDTFYPIRAVHSDELFSPYGSSGSCPEEEYVFLHTSRPEESEPINLNPYIRRFLVFDEIGYKDYTPSTTYYSCESFDSANKLLRQRAQQYKNQYESYLQDAILPSDNSNKWEIDSDKLFILLRIIDLDSLSLATPPTNLV